MATSLLAAQVEKFFDKRINLKDYLKRVTF